MQRYGEALRDLLKLCRMHPAGFDEIVICVLQVCEEARVRAGKSDVHLEQRRRDRQVLADLPRALDALDEVSRFVERYPEQVGWAAGHFILALREAVFRFGAEGAPDMPAAEMLRRLLALLADALRSSLPAKRGAFLHRFQEGGLVFERPRDQQDRGLCDPVLTTLFFQLVYLFRRFTGGATGRDAPWRGPANAHGWAALLPLGRGLH